MEKRRDQKIRAGAGEIPPRRVAPAVARYFVWTVRSVPCPHSSGDTLFFFAESTLPLRKKTNSRILMTTTLHPAQLALLAFCLFASASGQQEINLSASNWTTTVNSGDAILVNTGAAVIIASHTQLVCHSEGPDFFPLNFI
jgi:hypothetical protein